LGLGETEVEELGGFIGVAVFDHGGRGLVPWSIWCGQSRGTQVPRGNEGQLRGG